MKTAILFILKTMYVSLYNDWFSGWRDSGNGGYCVPQKRIDEHGNITQTFKTEK